MKRLLLASLLFATTARADDSLTTLTSTQRTINLHLRDQTDSNKFYNSADFTASPCSSSACCKYKIDGGTVTSCTNQPTADSRKGYNFTMAASELSGCETEYTFEDQSGTKRWADKSIHVYTYGGPNACHKTPQVRRD